MSQDDVLFGQIAEYYQLLSRQQISECLALRRVDASSSMGDICLLRGYLTQEQVRYVQEQQAAYRQSQNGGTGTAPPQEKAKPRRQSILSDDVRDKETPILSNATSSHTRGTRSSAENKSVQSSGGSASISGQAHRSIATTPAAPSALPVKVDSSLVRILCEARRRSCSDVHLVAGRPVAYRFAGRLTQEGEAQQAQQVQSMLLSVMDEHQRRQLDTCGYSDFAIDIEGAGRMRANVGKQASGLKGCFRLIGDTVPSLSSLGLPPELAKITDYHQGLAIVSGPNGQGKTSTMAALVNRINDAKPYHIITVEDPVEYLYPVSRALVSQRQVGVHTKSFARALKAALREDPDVIVIGELRDLETVEIALEAAETGHLVIGTMSTRSGAKTIDRLIDMFPPDRQSPVRATLAGALKLIISQRLLVGCNGQMVAAAEMITGGIQLWNLIRDNKLIQLPSLMQRGQSMGMLRLDESLKHLVVQKRITEEAALAAAENPKQLKQDLMKGHQTVESPSGVGVGMLPTPHGASEGAPGKPGWRPPDTKEIGAKLTGLFRRRNKD